MIQPFPAGSPQPAASGVLRDHLAVLEAARQRTALLRSRMSPLPTQSAAPQINTAGSSNAPQPVTGVLRNYLATRQAGLAQQSGGTTDLPPAQLAAEPGPGPSTQNNVGSPTGVLRDYLANLKARQQNQPAGQSQQPAAAPQHGGEVLSQRQATAQSSTILKVFAEIGVKLTFQFFKMPMLPLTNNHHCCQCQKSQSKLRDRRRICLSLHLSSLSRSNISSNTQGWGQVQSPEIVNKLLSCATLC